MAISAFEIDSEMAPALTSFVASLKSVDEALSRPDSLGRSVFYCVEDNSEVASDSPSEYVKDALGDLNCRDNQKDGQVTRYPGVVEISPEAWNALQQLNEAKVSLRDAVNRCYGAGAKSHELRNSYIRAGLPRLHPLLAWRKVALVDVRPQSIGFTVAKGIDSIERMSVAQAIAQLEGVGDDVIEQIARYPRNASVSWHEPTSPHIRANFVWATESPPQKKQLHACLPFFVPMGHWPSKRVRWNPPKNTESEQRNDALKGDRFELPFRAGGFLVITR